MQIYHKILRQVQEGVFACFSPGSRAIDYEEMLMIVCGAGISEGEADSSWGALVRAVVVGRTENRGTLGVTLTWAACSFLKGTEKVGRPK